MAASTPDMNGAHNEVASAENRLLWVKPEVTRLGAGSAEAGGELQDDGGIGLS